MEESWLQELYLHGEGAIHGEELLSRTCVASDCFSHLSLDPGSCFYYVRGGGSVTALLHTQQSYCLRGGQKELRRAQQKSLLVEASLGGVVTAWQG